MSEPEGPWITEQIECRSCGWEWTCVHPACELVQCPNCNDMTKTHFIDQCEWANDGAMETMGRMGDTINRLIAERDRYREALERIADMRDISQGTGYDRAKIARVALTNSTN